MNLRVAVAMTFALGCSGETNSPQLEQIEPSFASIQRVVFNASCSATSCHGSTAKAGLTLTPGSSYANLVNVTSQNDNAHSPQFKRVLPGSPDSSFLWIKLTNPGPQQGDRMPQVGNSLPDEYLQAIRTWIVQGAQNN
ncbi:MAG: hypothetical protein A2X67_02790 [Ignavibacteria bacterium GWA2_55_11]|nr:MAG: hypothetical protein A2X67_02790 [Ignavibacteria bacterium GWA2_55_11]OGU43347.1 MAG: hypothetical protein A2X68_08800 [Ignavibacteria bacterium GWC2_56_12]OGU62958.1 MAG: hypothetical protein A3C56_11065 [Ignavibacteria bacterium RIFCSPHIGHO2_02_FULL_56_12]OGU71533.1 MAG: hypothetical protein A3G43_11750 [Ignavibacteria bacterium RIFCSPLOWO2_12_FULL_56_21]OGU72792.1 MAG: hypothetical protein A3H45_04690 [Ignavibacteria bacterium RIFCSPLOWO2_02_FULL_55_14]HAV22493.1 hypothetical protei